MWFEFVFIIILIILTTLLIVYLSKPKLPTPHTQSGFPRNTGIVPPPREENKIVASQETHSNKQDYGNLVPPPFITFPKNTGIVPPPMEPEKLPSPPIPRTVIGFFPNWGIYSKNYQPHDVPVDILQQISYSFFDVAKNDSGLFVCKTTDAYSDFDKRYTDSGALSFDSWNDNTGPFGSIGQFTKIKKTKPFTLRLAIGGWTLSKNFSLAVGDQANRESFSQSIVDLLLKYPVFTAIDIDWEYLSGNGENYGNVGNIVSTSDPANFVSFLTLLRSKLAKVGLQNTSIGANVNPAPEKIQFDVKSVCDLLDYVEIMTYDFHDGSWGETFSAHHTNPRPSKFGKYSCEEAAKAWIEKGVASTKLLIGVAMYSRGFSSTDGLGKPAIGGSTDSSGEAGIVGYKDLPLNGSTEMWDDEAKASYSYDPVKRVFNSYDTPASVVEKCKIVKELNLAGIICWDLSTDNPRLDRNLIKVLHDNLL